MKNIVLLSLLAAAAAMVDAAPAAAQAPGRSSSAKACAICHFRWIETFFVQGRGTEIVDYQAEKVVATSDMCFSCHDGSIMDSRARMIRGKGHTTGGAPPASMEIPELFPLDEDGRIDCATCHTAHGVSSEEGTDTTIFMRTSNHRSAMCRRCHPGRHAQGGGPAANHPMGSIEGKIPPEILAQSKGTPRRADEMICETCHTAHGSSYEGYLVKSYRNSSLCLACHPEKSVVAGKGWRKPGHVVNVTPQTARIPDALLEKGALLGERGTLICSTCHNVHGDAVSANLLITGSGRQSALCLNCHADKKDVAETSHNLERAEKPVTNLQGQTVSEAGVCSACHLPHKPARDLSGEGDFTTRLCMSCHGPEKFAARPRVAAPSHPVRVEPLATDRSGRSFRATSIDPERLTLPLYDDYGVRKRRGEMTCTTCHDPHRRTPGTVSTKEDGENSTFLRRPPLDLCRQCHEEKFRIGASKHNLAQTAPDSTNSLEQTPAQAGLCANCHLSHGGKETFLWARPLPDKAATDPPAPCFSCHREGGAAASRTLGPNGHPVHVDARQPASTAGLPLFDTEGRLSEEGKIACYTCHDPHRWNPDTEVSAADALAAEGDSTNSFLRLQNAPSAALCTGCHPDRAAVDQTAHDLHLSAPESRNALGQSPQASGPCGACHLPHRSKNDLLLWARQIPADPHVMEGLCVSCHAEDAPAAGKIPAVATHPQDMVLTNTERHTAGQEDYFPIFDAATGEPVANGVLSCPSCHDSHRWSPGGGNGGGGIDVEGDSASSFLRNKSFNTICVDCHGLEALYRYQYFHDPKNRDGATARQRTSGGFYPGPAGVR